MDFLKSFIENCRKFFNSKKHKNSSANNSSNESIFIPRSKEPNFLLSILMTTLKMFFILIVIIGVSGAGAFLGIAKAYVETTPTLDVGKIEDQDQTSFIYDGNGNLITDFSSAENRVWANIDEIPANLQNAFIAIEDVRFRSHKGVDIKRLFGAFVNNLKNQDVQGGSTITQQLIKNTMLSSERTYKRKIQEAYLSMELEKHYSKDQILEAYLNTIHLGESNYGVKAAAQDYFGKDLSQLNLRECATLAGITKNPYLYDPRKNAYDPKRNIETTNNRTNLVLYEMYENNLITESQYKEALSTPLKVVEESKHTQLYEMPYFVEYAIYDVINHMLKQRNLEDTKQNRATIEHELRTKGYKIYTTVDPVIQKTVEDSLYNWKHYPPLRNSKDKYVITSDGRKIEQPQAAAAVFDYHSGEIKAVVGGRLPPSQKKELNRAYQANMPVGSSIKPLAVYGPAIDKGASPATIIYNIPAKINGWGGKGYPNNYGGGGFTGPIDMRHGLMQSLNVVAARTLFDYVGLDDSFNYLVSLGVNPNHINKDGPGLALGTSGITPVEMAVAFGAIGNRGVYQEPLSFTKVVDSTGKVVLDAKANQVKRTVFKPSTAWLLVDMMEDAVAAGTGTRAKIKGMNVAGKTGTNSDQRGVFFSGITPYYSAAVWVGHDQYKQLYSGAQGGRNAAPLWQDFMSKIHKGLKNKPILPDTPKSLGLVRVTVDGVSGLLATPASYNDASGHNPVTDWFVKGTAPTQKDDWHHQVVLCSSSNKLAGPYCPDDTKVTKGVVVIPENSPIRNLSTREISKYIKNAVPFLPDSIDMSTIDPTNPTYSKYICDVHTKEWYDQEQQNDQIIQSAASNIAAIQEKIKQLSGKITQDQINKINISISNVNKAIDSGDVAAIQNALNQLNQTANQIFTIINNSQDSGTNNPSDKKNSGNNGKNTNSN